MADTHVVNASCNDARFDACTSVDDVSYSEASQNIDSYKNDVVRWGGFIVDIENEENHSLILVEFHPLDESGHPQLDQPSEGEFVIKTSKPLDSGIYVEYSEVTVVGILDGDISLPVDEKNESLPLIVSTDPEKYPYLLVEGYHTGKIPLLLGRGVGIIMTIPVCVAVSYLTYPGGGSEFCADALWNAGTARF
jgi:outer membrane lipoprotein